MSREICDVRQKENVLYVRWVDNHTDLAGLGGADIALTTLGRVLIQLFALANEMDTWRVECRGR